MLQRVLTTRRTRLIAAAVVLLSAAAGPVALGAGEGESMRGGVRNPSPPGELRGEQLLTQQVGGACVIGGSAQGGPNL